jgi:hypothetical protein
MRWSRKSEHDLKSVTDLPFEASVMGILKKDQPWIRNELIARVQGFIALPQPRAFGSLPFARKSSVLPTRDGGILFLVRGSKLYNTPLPLYPTLLFCVLMLLMPPTLRDRRQQILCDAV